MRNITYIPHQSQEIESISNTFQIEMLDYLIRSAHRYKLLFPSQECIAQVVGCTRRTVNTHLRFFAQQGWIHKKRRYNTTCLYTLSDIFYKKAHVLKRKFTSLKFVLNWHDLAEFWTVKKEALTNSFNAIFSSRKKKDIYNLSVGSYITRERAWLCETFIPEEGKPKKYKIGARMEQPPISSDIKMLTKALGLTKWGQIKLSIYPPAAITYAMENCENLSGFHHPFKFLLYKADEYCKNNSIKPDWAAYYRYAEQYKMPQKPKWVFEKPSQVKSKWNKEDISQKLEQAQLRYDQELDQKRQQRAQRLKNDPEYAKSFSVYSHLLKAWIKENL